MDREWAEGTAHKTQALSCRSKPEKLGQVMGLTDGGAGPHEPLLHTLRRSVVQKAPSGML